MMDNTISPSGFLDFSGRRATGDLSAVVQGAEAEANPPLLQNVSRGAGQHRLDGSPFMVGEFIANDSGLQFGSLNHRRPAKLNAPFGPPASGLLSG